MSNSGSHIVSTPVVRPSVSQLIHMLMGFQKCSLIFCPSFVQILLVIEAQLTQKLRSSKMNDSNPSPNLLNRQSQAQHNTGQEKSKVVFSVRNYHRNRTLGSVRYQL